MDRDARVGGRLPVLVTARGPLYALARHVHELTQTSRSHEALAVLEVYEPFARDFGDEKTVAFLIQARMFAYISLGRLPEALASGERLLSHHEAAGSTLSAAKTLADLANVYLRADRVGEAMRCLARAGLLLDQTSVRNERYVAALASLMAAATYAELYEAADAAYQQLSQWWTATGGPDISASYDFIYAEALLVWGLRLDHLGNHSEAAARLRAAADIFGRWCDAYASHGATDQSRWFNATRALALAKLGEVDRARELTADIVVPLRAQEDWYGARLAHLALGISLRAQGDLTAAARELRAAEELVRIHGNAVERLIVRFELAVLAAERLGVEATRDLRDLIADQNRQLWQLRLQRVAMLRHARQREEHEEARQRAEKALMHDPLTGLANRRHLDQLMAGIDAGQQLGPTVLLIVDVDNFKTINDTYSHSVGDQVLCEIARILDANCRAQDVPIRYAGDEFVVFLHVDPTAARQVADRIRVTVRDSDFDHLAAGLRVSISIGAAALRPGMSAQELFNAADANLYQAKRGGRDQVAA